MNEISNNAIYFNIHRTNRKILLLMETDCAHRLRIIFFRKTANPIVLTVIRVVFKIKEKGFMILEPSLGLIKITACLP